MSNELTRTLPASWYCSLPLYQLERRAVFFKVCACQKKKKKKISWLSNTIQSWYLLGPVTRFLTVGDKVYYEIAQKSIYAVRTAENSEFPGVEDIKVACAETVRVV